MRCLGCSAPAPAPAAKIALFVSIMFCGIIGNAHAFVVLPANTYRHHRRRHHIPVFKRFKQTTTSNTLLFGLAEWRQRFAASPQPKPLQLLPFAPSDILPIGQSTTIVLKEGRYYDLFQDCIDDYESVMGMVIMGDDGLCDTLLLCDISDFDVTAGYRGKVTVSVTLRAVGRAALVELVQMKPIMMGMCLEMVDDSSTTSSDGGSTIEDDDEWTTAQELMKDIESTLQTLGLDSRYKDALVLAQEALVEGRTKDDGILEIDKHSRQQMNAASWAVFGACVPIGSSKMITSCLQEAIATSSPLVRLELGRKALLEMMYQGSDATNTSTAERSGDMMEFG